MEVPVAYCTSVERLPLSHQDAEYLQALLASTIRRDRRDELLSRMVKLQEHYWEQAKAQAQKHAGKKKFRKRAIRPCSKHEWPTVVSVFQLEILNGTSFERTLHFAASRQALANPMLDLLEQSDYLEQLEEELKEDLDQWLGNQLKKTSPAEYKKLYAEHVTDRLNVPEDVDELLRLCTETFEDGTFAIEEIQVPKDGILTRVETLEQSSSEAYDSALDDSNTVLADVQVPNT